MRLTDASLRLAREGSTTPAEFLAQVALAIDPLDIRALVAAAHLAEARGSRSALFEEALSLQTWQATEDEWYQMITFLIKCRNLRLAGRILCTDSVAAVLGERRVHLAAEIAYAREARDDVRQIYSEALDRAPANLRFLIALAQLKQLEGNYDASIAYYRQGLTVSPGDPEILSNLAMMQLGRTIARG